MTLVRDYGLLHEAELLPRSFGGNSWFGKFHPAAGKVLLKSLPAIIPAVLKGKVSIKGAMSATRSTNRTSAPSRRSTRRSRAARSASS